MKRMFLSAVCLLLTATCVPLVSVSPAAATTTTAMASSLDALKLTTEDLPEGCSFSDKDYTRSIQAKLLYEKPDMYGALIGEVTDKARVSVEGPDGDKGSVLYMVFSKPVMVDFIKGLLWGGDAPTKQHPEEILVADNLLVIVSFAQGSPVGQKIRETLEKRLSQ